MTEMTAALSATNTPAMPARIKVDGSTLFTMWDDGHEVSLPKGTMLPAFSDAVNPFIPARHDGYLFRRDILRNVLAFLRRPHGDALYVTGPTGSGKTSVILETAARLNWPVQQVTCNGRMEFAQLKGQFILASQNPGEAPSMVWRDGPLTTAMRQGHILLLNEIDMMSPSELAGLNDVLEGRPLVIAETGGEIVKPHPMFRVVATANSSGNGDASGLYEGVQPMNIASMDRYRFLNVDYIDTEAEKSLLAKQIKHLPGEILGAMCDLAKSARSLFVEEKIRVPISTRSLLRWAFLAQDFRQSPCSVAEAFDQAILARACARDRNALINSAKTIFGDLIKFPETETDSSSGESEN